VSWHPTVVVVTRATRPGKAKTRLQPLLGAAGCAGLQHALITHTAATVASAAPTSPHIAVDPPDAVAEIADIAEAAASVFAQHGSDLGARMRAAPAHVAQIRPGPVVLIGGDVPHLRAGHILDAARQVEDSVDVVFGPALDGGYYLIAFARPTPEVFDIDPDLWGGPLVLEADDARHLAADDTVATAIRSILNQQGTTTTTRLSEGPPAHVSGPA